MYGILDLRFLLFSLSFTNFNDFYFIFFLNKTLTIGFKSVNEKRL